MPPNRDVVFGQLRTWYKGCPDPDDLAAFARGALSSEDVDAIAAHIPNCPKCSESLDTVVEDDSLIIDLRELLHDAPPVPPRPAGAPAAKDSPCPPPERLGQYLIKEKLGQGSMGIVYRAIQENLNRVVAVKVSSYGSVWSAAAAKRIATECEAIARLQHRHIVHVYERAEHEGVPYFSMEYCGGGSLSAKLAQGPLSEREAAELVRDLALAVEYAHDHNVLHRDLKPGNVLFDDHGAVRLTDFGLARLIDTAGNETATNFIMGTPSYMAPEQAAGHMRKLGPHTDVYGLGAILYACLTGKPPFSAATSIEILKLVQNSWPARPAQLRPGLSPTLESICLKCLERAPRSRFRSAKQLADDLDRWLAGLKPHASEWRQLKRVWRMVRPFRWVALVLIVGSAGLFAGSLYYPNPDRARARILEGMEKDLAAGKPVTLIGEVGGPKADYRWMAGGDTAKESIGPDGLFTVNNWVTSLLELWGDTRTDSYQVTAQIRHDSVIMPGNVGLYCACEAFPQTDPSFLVFVNLDFNSVKTLPEKFLTKMRKPISETPSGLYLQVFPLHGQQEGMVAYRGALGPGLKPLGEHNGVWHDVTLTVSPNGVRGLLNGSSFFISSNIINQTFEDLHRAFPNNSDVRILPRSFRPRGSVGLYIERGTAAFRSVTITKTPVVP